MRYINLSLQEAIQNQKLLLREGKFFNIFKESINTKTPYYLIPTCPRGFQPNLRGVA